MHSVAGAFLFNTRSWRDDVRFARAASRLLHIEPEPVRGLFVTPGRNPLTVRNMPEIPSSSTDDEAACSDVDVFHDASEIKQFDMDLTTALDECSLAIRKFFNNEVQSAYSIMKPWKDHSLYHAHGAAIFEFIPAMLTLDREQSRRAQGALNHTLNLYEQTRKSATIIQTLGSIIKKANYDSYTDLEAHAELINAECQLLIACLGAFECEDMKGLLRASLRIKSSFSCYKTCYKILEKKTWATESVRDHFESGVILGLATFNVMIAMLPPKLIAVLEFVGFTANKEKGLAELLEAVDHPGLRTVMSRITLLTYHLVIGHYAALPPNFLEAEKILLTSLNAYPSSVWFLLFKGRYLLLSGMIDEAIEVYNSVIECTNTWPQIKHLAYWECMWANIMMMRWRQAASFAELLVRESNWSTTIYMYAQAATIMELKESATIEERNTAEALFRSAPTNRQRLLGRSIPMEKFVAKRCERRFSHGISILPSIEMLCLWNMFPALAKNTKQADKVLKLIEATHKEIKSSRLRSNGSRSNSRAYNIEDEALLNFLLGAMYSAMGLPRLAIEHLKAVLHHKDEIKQSLFLLPYSTVEMAMCHFSLEDTRLAIDLLNDARTKYSGYILDSRLHFRIHANLNLIRAHKAAIKEAAGKKPAPKKIAAIYEDRALLDDEITDDMEEMPPMEKPRLKRQAPVVKMRSRRTLAASRAVPLTAQPATVITNEPTPGPSRATVSYDP